MISPKLRVSMLAGAAAVGLLLAAGAHGADPPKTESQAKPVPKAEPQAKPEPKTEPPFSDRIVGAWSSDPFDSPLGKATQSFCFSENGSMTIRSETREGPRSGAGTYKLDRDRLSVSLQESGSSMDLGLGWSGELLILTDPSGEARKFHRTAERCETEAQKP